MKPSASGFVVSAVLGGLLGSTSTLAAAINTKKPLAASARSSSDWTSTEWDAIIVGGGTAGIIVADRLSEAGKKTLLLEIGGASYGITGGTERPGWLNGTSLSRVDVPGLCKWAGWRWGWRAGSSLPCFVFMAEPS